MNEIKENILNIKLNTASNEIDENTAYQNRFKAISIEAKTAKLWNNPKKKQKIEKLLVELEKLFAEE